MQILVSLRPADANAPGSDFGHGCVERVSPSAPAASILKFSGSVEELTDGAILQAELERVRRNDSREVRPEVWTVKVGANAVSFDVVKERYVFAPAQIRGEVLSKYTRLRDIRFCRTPKLPCEEVLGVASISAVDEAGDFEQVILGDGRSGWLYLPNILQQSETVTFTEAIIRLMRGDLAGADSLLNRVQASNANTGLQIDALLLRASIHERTGRSGITFLELAKEMNPGLKAVMQTEIMMNLERLRLAPDAHARKRWSDTVREQLHLVRSLFDADDKWFVSASKLVDEDGTTRR